MKWSIKGWLGLPCMLAYGVLMLAIVSIAAPLLIIYIAGQLLVLAQVVILKSVGWCSEVEAIQVESELDALNGR